MDRPYVIVLTTWPVDREPLSFAETLVRERLAACVNVMGDMLSFYTWKGNVQRERERQVVIKTSAARVEELKARIASLHPYEVPEVLVLPIDGGGEAYLRWIGDSTGPAE